MRRIVLLSICVLSGCMLGPNYHPPCTCVPDFEGEPCITESVKSCEEPLCAWWKIFDDPLLEKYVLLGAAHNFNVLQAEANILQARAVREVTASKLYPQFEADFNALRLALSRNGIFDSFGQRFFANRIFNLFNAFIDVKWEIDLFGKTRRDVEAASAHVCSVIENRNDILISVLAEIAVNYFGVRSGRERAHLIEGNIALLEKNAAIVRAQFASGYRNGLDLRKIEAELATARADLPDVYSQIYSSMYALSILTGNLPEEFVCEMMIDAPLPIPPLKVAVGLRSDLLRRRPDVRRAERDLAAATAEIGVAVASFFPTIKLFGLIGFDSLRFNNLFQAGSKFWLLDADIKQPLFQGGKLSGNLKASSAAACAACANYHQTVLEALAETEKALVSYVEELVTTGLLEEAVGQDREVVKITNERYTKGLVNVIEFLDAERQLISAELNLLQSHTNSLFHLIALYKALGGGWDCALVERNCVGEI